MIFLNILIHILFWYSIGSILALLIVHSALNNEEIIEVQDVLKAPDSDKQLAEYYRVSGWCSWAIVLQWINGWFRRYED